MARISLLELASLTLLAFTVGAGACASDSPPAPTPSGLDFDFRIELTPVTLNPGEERFTCQFVAPDGVERWLKAFDTETSVGAHHVAVFRVANAKESDYGPVVCGGADDKVHHIDGMLPGSNQQASGEPLELPTGVGLRLAPTDGLYIQEHFVNSTTAPMQTQITWKAASVSKAEVVHPAGLISWNQTGFIVPPGNSKATEACELPQSMTILMTTGHMHQLGLEFSANVDGHQIFDTKEWSEPVVQSLGAGFQAKHGDVLTFACSYGNASGRVVHAGFKQTDEMCTFVAIYYPAVDTPDITSCTAPSLGGGTGGGVGSGSSGSGGTNGGDDGSNDFGVGNGPLP